MSQHTLLNYIMDQNWMSPLLYTYVHQQVASGQHYLACMVCNVLFINCINGQPSFARRLDVSTLTSQCRSSNHVDYIVLRCRHLWTNMKCVNHAMRTRRNTALNNRGYHHHHQHHHIHKTCSGCLDRRSWNCD